MYLSWSSMDNKSTLSLVLLYLSFSTYYLFLLIGICNRKGICGPQTATCNETVVFDSIKKISHFACICSSTFILIGDKCPEETVNATTVFISNTTAVTNPTSTSTKNSISSTMQTDTKCNGNSHLFVEPILIILLNLVYFVNKWNEAEEHKERNKVKGFS